MSLFRKIFGTSNPASDEEKENEYGQHTLASNAPVDEKFIFNFKKKV